MQAGVKKHGSCAGSWIDIPHDSAFKSKLAKRSDVNLRDKWRAMENKSRLKFLAREDDSKNEPKRGRVNAVEPAKPPPLATDLTVFDRPANSSSPERERAWQTHCRSSSLSVSTRPGTT